MHSSPVREVFPSAGEVALQPRRRQVVFGGTATEGSSDSDSGGAGDGAAGGAVTEARAAGKDWEGSLVAMGLGAGGMSSGVLAGGGGSGLGVSSTVECLPVVHGGIARNSSKVR